MVVARTWRRFAVMVVSLGALALAGCGGDPPTGPEGAGTGQLGAAPDGSATPDPSGTPASTPGGGGGTGGGGAGGGGGGGSDEPSEVQYPSTARAYAEALLRAWAKPDYDRLSELGTPATVQQIRDSITYGGNPNADWTYISCGASQTYGSTDCVFRNSHGDQATITLIDAQVGYHNAVTAALLDRTEYPSSPVSYVTTLLTARADGNNHRVIRLSNQTVANRVTCTFGYSATSEPIDATRTKVIVTETGGSQSRSYEFTVLSQPGGKPGAVTAVVADCT